MAQWTNNGDLAISQGDDHFPIGSKYVHVCVMYAALFYSGLMEEWFPSPTAST